MALDKDLADSILKSISLSGVADMANARVKQIVSVNGENLNHVLSLSSGSPRIQSNVIKRFKLLLSQPLRLEAMNPFEIRCCLCKKVVSYPVWYYEVKYAINHFHYFVCFSPLSKDKPSADCYRKG